MQKPRDQPARGVKVCMNVIRQDSYQTGKLKGNEEQRRKFKKVKVNFVKSGSKAFIACFELLILLSFYRIQ